MKKFTDKQIVQSWKNNVKPWVAAIQDEEIETRILVTNKAIIDVVISRKPKTILDLGCGEGWLIRELNNYGIDSLGIDVVPEFLNFAKKKGVGRFKVLSYEEISFETIKEKFDVIVCNFSLIGNESVISIFKEISSLLNKDGSFVIQTINPISIVGENKYEDGWRKGSWEGFSEDFVDPAPWYFRTLESWESLFRQNGLNLVDMVEPLNPATNIPASIIFVGEPAS